MTDTSQTTNLRASAGVEWTRYGATELALALDSVVAMGFASLDVALDWSAHELTDGSGSTDFESPALSLSNLCSLADSKGLKIRLRVGPLNIESTRGGGVPPRVREDRACYVLREQRAPALHLVRARVEPKFSLASEKFLRLSQEWVIAACQAAANAQQKHSAIQSITVGPGTSALFAPNGDTDSNVAFVQALAEAVAEYAPGIEQRVAYAGPAMDEPLFHALAERWPIDVALPGATAGEGVIADSVAYALRYARLGVDFSVLSATPGLMRPLPPQHAVDCAMIARREGATSLSMIGIAGGDQYVGSVIDDRGELRQDSACVKDFLQLHVAPQRREQSGEPQVVPVAMSGVTSGWLAQLGFVKSP